MHPPTHSDHRRNVGPVRRPEPSAQRATRKNYLIRSLTDRAQVVISNNSGSTGAKLARRDDAGESIAAITDAFPHWFPPTYQQYAGNADSLPVDQHELLALVAPGRVVVGSASDDGNADPQGEFLSYLGAAPVYDLYGLGNTGLSSSSWPPTGDKGFRGPAMSYHLRTGSHGLEGIDWEIYLTGKLFKR